MNDKFFSKKYKVKKEIASGGMGTIYLATDTKLGRDVAIKMLHPQYSGELAFAQRFLREAWAMAKLDHPNIIRIWSVEEEEGSHCIVMEYFHGQDLKQIIRTRGPLPIAEVLPITIQIIQGLAYAHYMGIIHRDIKPANILVDQEGKVKITDFGIAAAFTESSLTMDGTVMGTPEYMAPEQARAESVGSHTDLYSVGILMYELLTGQTPYKGIPAHSLVAKLAFESENPPLNFPPHIPGKLQDLIINMTQKRVEDRLKDINEILTILKNTVSSSHELQPDTDETTLFSPAEASTPSGAPFTQTAFQDQPIPTQTKPGKVSNVVSKQTPQEENLGTRLEQQAPASSQIRILIISTIGILAFVGIMVLVLSQWPVGELLQLPSDKAVHQSDSPDKVETTIENLQQISQDIQTTQKEINQNFESLGSTLHSSHEEITNKKIPLKIADAQDWLEKTKKEVAALVLNKGEIEKSQQLLLNNSKKAFASSMQQGEQLLQEDLSQDQQKRLNEATNNLKKTQQALETTFTNHLQNTKILLSKLEDVLKKSERTFLASKNPPSKKSKLSKSSPSAATQIANLRENASQISTKIQEFRFQMSTQYHQLTQQVDQYAMQISSLESHTQTGKLEDTVANLGDSLGKLQDTITQYAEKHNQQAKMLGQRQTEILVALNDFTESPLTPPLKEQASHILQTLKSNQKELEDLKQLNWKDLEATIARALRSFNKVKDSLKEARSPDVQKVPSSNNIEVVNRILDDFRTAYENRDLLHLKLTTAMSESRTRNLIFMFKTYTTIDIHTEIVSTSESQAKAKIFIDKLINKEGENITPNFIIRETTITIPKKNGKWGKIQW